MHVEHGPRGPYIVKPRKMPACIPPLIKAGIEEAHAFALRRIALTLRMWFEYECGTERPGRPGVTFAIERDGDEPDSTPYMRTMFATSSGYHDSRRKIPDREMGARKRLAKIMKQYPTLGYYIQGDCRGASIYILRPGDVPQGERADAFYNNGLAVY